MISKNLNGLYNVKPKQVFQVSGTYSISSDLTASVTMSNTTSTDGLSLYNLTFYIPKGANGTNGINGTNGTNATNGTNGTNGTAATITIGTVSTVSTSTPASVTNVGTSTAAILNFSLPKGETGPQGPSGDNYSMFAILIGALGGAALSAFSGFLSNIIDDIMSSLGLTSRPDPTNEQRIEALARLINQLQNEVNSLQNQVNTINGEITTIQTDLGYVQDKVRYQSTYTDIYLNNITSFSSDLSVTNGLFGESCRISQNGAASFGSLKTGTINTPYGSLRINGNLTVNGMLIHKFNGNYVVTGGIWDF